MQYWLSFLSHLSIALYLFCFLEIPSTRSYLLFSSSNHIRSLSRATRKRTFVPSVTVQFGKVSKLNAQVHRSYEDNRIDYSLLAQELALEYTLKIAIEALSNFPEDKQKFLWKVQQSFPQFDLDVIMNQSIANDLEESSFPRENGSVDEIFKILSDTGMYWDSLSNNLKQYLLSFIIPSNYFENNLPTHTIFQLLETLEQEGIDLPSTSISVQDYLFNSIQVSVNGLDINALSNLLLRLSKLRMTWKNFPPAFKKSVQEFLLSTTNMESGIDVSILLTALDRLRANSWKEDEVKEVLFALFRRLCQLNTSRDDLHIQTIINFLGNTDFPWNELPEELRTDLLNYLRKSPMKFSTPRDLLVFLTRLGKMRSVWQVTLSRSTRENLLRELSRFCDYFSDQTLRGVLSSFNRMNFQWNPEPASDLFQRTLFHSIEKRIVEHSWTVKKLRTFLSRLKRTGVKWNQMPRPLQNEILRCLCRELPSMGVSKLIRWFNIAVGLELDWIAIPTFQQAILTKIVPLFNGSGPSEGMAVSSPSSSLLESEENNEGDDEDEEDIGEDEEDEEEAIVLSGSINGRKRIRFGLGFLRCCARSKKSLGDLQRIVGDFLPSFLRSNLRAMNVSHVSDLLVSLDRLHVSWSRDLDEDIHQEMWHRLSDLSTKAGELSQLSYIVHILGMMGLTWNDFPPAVQDNLQAQFLERLPELTFHEFSLLLFAWNRVGFVWRQSTELRKSFLRETIRCLETVDERNEVSQQMVVIVTSLIHSLRHQQPVVEWKALPKKLVVQLFRGIKGCATILNQLDLYNILDGMNEMKIDWQRDLPKDVLDALAESMTKNRENVLIFTDFHRCLWMPTFSAHRPDLMEILTKELTRLLQSPSSLAKLLPFPWQFANLLSNAHFLGFRWFADVNIRKHVFHFFLQEKKKLNEISPTNDEGVDVADDDRGRHIASLLCSLIRSLGGNEVKWAGDVKDSLKSFLLKELKNMSTDFSLHDLHNLIAGFWKLGVCWQDEFPPDVLNALFAAMDHTFRSLSSVKFGRMASLIYAISKSFRFDELPSSLQSSFLTLLSRMDIDSTVTLSSHDVTKLLTGLSNMEISWDQLASHGGNHLHVLLRRLIEKINAEKMDRVCISNLMQSFTLISFDSRCLQNTTNTNTTDMDRPLDANLIAIHQRLLDHYERLGFRSTDFLEASAELTLLAMYREAFLVLPSEYQRAIILRSSENDRTSLKRRKIPILPALPEVEVSELQKRLLLHLEQDIAKLPIQWKENRFSLINQFEGLKTGVFPMNIALQDKGKVKILIEIDSSIDHVILKKISDPTNPLNITAVSDDQEKNDRETGQEGKNEQKDNSAEEDIPVTAEEKAAEIRKLVVPIVREVRLKRAHLLKIHLYQHYFPDVPCYRVQMRAIFRYPKEISQQFVIALRDNVPFHFQSPAARDARPSSAKRTEQDTEKVTATNGTTTTASSSGPANFAYKPIYKSRWYTADHSDDDPRVVARREQLRKKRRSDIEQHMRNSNQNNPKFHNKNSQND